MGRVIFMNVSSTGHVIPTLELMVELIQRGQEVIYYEILRFREEIESLGATFRCYPEVNPQREQRDFVKTSALRPSGV